MERRGAVPSHRTQLLAFFASLVSVVHMQLARCQLGHRESGCGVATVCTCILWARGLQGSVSGMCMQCMGDMSEAVFLLSNNYCNAPQCVKKWELIAAHPAHPHGPWRSPHRVARSDTKLQTNLQSMDLADQSSNYPLKNGRMEAGPRPLRDCRGRRSSQGPLLVLTLLDGKGWFG